jgi:p-aminobenzoyl-glutamate transporter AbgT
MTHFDSELSAFNFENQTENSNDEAAANSIINVKNLKITFANKYANFEGFRTYLYGVIVPYVTQLIPSTTILNIEFEGVEASKTVQYDIAQGVGII